MAEVATSIQEMIVKYDRENLRTDFDRWPDLSEATWNGPETPEIDWKYEKVLLAGMGGSGISGELVFDIALEKKSTIQFTTVKEYHLPSWVSHDALVIGISCSGNTEETLSVLSEAHKKGMSAVCFSSGGMLEAFCKKKWNFPFVKTSMLKVPRSSFPALFFAVLKFLAMAKAVNVSESQANETFEQMRKIKSQSSTADESNRAIQLARAISARPSLPLIYSSLRTRAVGLRFRQSLNENSKMHAFNSEVPELCHNEIVGWDSSRLPSPITDRQVRDGNGIAVFLRLQDDPDEIAVRFDIVKEIIERAGGSIRDPTYGGESYLARILSMLYFLDYATYFVAVLKAVDPMKTPSIDLLKREMGSKLDYTRRID